MDDKMLAEKARAGDEKAMDEILSRYKGTVNMIARSYFLIGGDMEDLVQEGMIGLYRAVMAYTPEKNAKFSTFAYICVRHQIQAAIKKANSHKNQILSKAYPILDQSDDEDAEIILPSDQPTPDEEVIANENMQELEQEINKKLSSMELEILSLYLKGYNYSEISEMSGCNLKSIDNALTRIKNKLTFLKKAE